MESSDPRSIDHVPGSRSNKSSFLPKIEKKLSRFIPLIAGAAFLVVLGVVGLTVLEKNQQVQTETETKEKQAKAATSMASEVANSVQGQGMTPAFANKPPQVKKPVVNEEEPQEGHKQQKPHDTNVRMMLPPEVMTVQSNRLRGFESALRSKTTVSFKTEEMDRAVSRTSYSAPADDPMALYKQRLAEVNGTLPQADVPSVGSVQPSLSRTGGSSLNAVEKFNRGNRWELANNLESPTSPFMLRAGFVIPAVMLSGIMSDIPGQVMAQVSQNVYDTSTGSILLIPQGTRLVGSYASNVAYGQSRLMMAWQRLVFPDGRTLDIEAMPGADQAGYSGFKDKVDNHYIRIFGSAILLSGVIAGVSLSQDDDNNDSDNQRASDALSEALGQTLGQAMAEMLRKNINIAPTLQIRPGYRFNVMVTKDLKLPGAYRAFEY